MEIAQMNSPRGSSSQSLLQQVKADLKKWEHEFQKKNSRVPLKTDVQACPSIQSLYRQYARLKLKLGKENMFAAEENQRKQSNQTSSGSHVQIESEPGLRIVDNVCVLPLQTGEKGRLDPFSLSERASDPSSSNISAAPLKPATAGCEKSLPVPHSSSKRKPLRLKSVNDSNIMPTVLSSSSRLSKKNCETSSKIKRAGPETALSERSLNTAGDLSSGAVKFSPKDSLPACLLVVEGGCAIRICRQGVQFNDWESSLDDLLPAGFLASSGPSSLIRKGHEARNGVLTEEVTTGDDSFTEKVTSRDDSLAEKVTTGDDGVLTEVKPRNVKRKLTSDSPFLVTASPVQSPQDSSVDESHKASGVTSCTKRAKINEPLEESSWANPVALRKGSKKQTDRSAAERSTRSKKYEHPCEKPGERNNFVKLNINGKGGKRRKVLNGTRSRRPGAYGRRTTGKTNYKRKERMGATDGVPANEGNEAHDNCLKPLRSSGPGGDKIGSLWVNDGWLEASASCESSQPTDESQRDDGLEEIVDKVQQNPSDENLTEVLHLVFGFKTFRTGQLEAIKRVLSLQSTMVILPTGAGKSLCYQLPAFLFSGITLVISPLVALMADQLQHLPPKLPGALISSAQTFQESSSSIAKLRAGQVKVLFISPERLFSESFFCILSELPKISLAVIDEAHCLSEWSHNFRPSYFRLGKVLLDRMKVPCVLAMTATATKKAERSILKPLNIPSDGVVQASRVRHNLLLSVSREANRLKSLLSMLQCSPYSGAKSIIIYCTFQAETENVSRFLQQNGIKAKSYHSKKTSEERKRIYDLFFNNKLRVVVATVAFGMGLDKSDVSAIVHYNLPRSLEHFVQETGRAGRDGNPAYCHLYLDDGDYLKLRSLAYSDGVDEYSVNKFLARVFEGATDSKISGNLVSIIVEAASRELDMKEEVMETILSFLEVGEVQYVKVLSKLNSTCTLTFHQSNPTSLAGRNTFVAAIMKRSQEKHGRFVFDIPSLATELKLSLFSVQSELRRLQAAGEIMYELGDPSLCFTVLQIPENMCSLTSTITTRLTEAEHNQVRKIDAMYSAASTALCSMDGEVSQENNPSTSFQQASLQSCIKQYFERDEDLPLCDSVPSIIQTNSCFLRSDIKVFIKTSRNANLTGRAVARIFHGLWSPAFSFSEWSKNHLWGKHVRIDFAAIKQVAAAEILSQHVNNPNLFRN